MRLASASNLLTRRASLRFSTGHQTSTAVLSIASDPRPADINVRKIAKVFARVRQQERITAMFAARSIWVRQNLQAPLVRTAERHERIQARTGEASILGKDSR